MISREDLRFVLQCAHDLFQAPGSWAKEGESFAEDGSPVSPWDDRAASWDIPGALHRAIYLGLELTGDAASVALLDVMEWLAGCLPVTLLQGEPLSWGPYWRLLAFEEMYEHRGVVVLLGYALTLFEEPCPPPTI